MGKVMVFDHPLIQHKVTMMRMKDVVDEVKARKCTAKVIIGGACINKSFMDEIGADGYSEDAADCVKLVQSLI